MGRAPCCDKANVKKGPWSPEEDAKLKSYIEQHGTGGNWIALPQKIGLKRCGKSCRLRWLNYLRPNIKHGGFSEEEDNIICSLYITIGSRWSIIAAQLPGRTDNDIKNYWNTKLKKKLLGRQRRESQAHPRRAAKQEAKRDEEQEEEEEEEGGGVGVGDGYWPERNVPICGRSSLVLPSQHIYGDSPSFNMVPCSFSGGCSSATAQNPNGLAAELDEILHGSLDCFFGTTNIVGGSGGASSSSSGMNWTEVSPLVYPTLAASYQGMQQCLLEEAVHLGTQ